MDDVPIGLLLGSQLLLIALSAFFSASETAMMALNRYRLRHLAESGHRGALYAQSLLANPERLLGTILLGNNLVNVAAAQITTIIALRYFGDVGIGIAGFVFTIVLLIFAEVPPKTIAARYPERIALPAAYVLRIVVRVARPVVRLVNWAGRIVTRPFKGQASDKDDDQLTAQELSAAVRASGEHIPQSHQDMVLRILDLEKITMDDIMVPRSNIEAVDLDDEWDEVVDQLATARHTRIPVYRGSLDNLLGTLHVRRVLHLLEAEEEERSLDKLIELVRKPYFVPEDAPMSEQLLAMKNERRTLGFVVDEYGDLKGIATLDDIFKEIIGEFTHQLPGISDDVHIQDDGAYVVNGGANVRDLNRRMQWQLPTDGPKTVNGLILEYLEDIPQSGTGLRIGDYTMEIVQTSGTAVSVVRIRPGFAASGVNTGDEETQSPRTASA